MKKNINIQGIASLPSIIVLSMLIITLGVSVSLISFNENSLSFGATNSSAVLRLAQSGAKDCLKRIARDRKFVGNYNFELVSGGCSEPFAGCAAITVVERAGGKTITSVGRIRDWHRRVVVEAELDSRGEITSYTWQEY